MAALLLGFAVLCFAGWELTHAQVSQRSCARWKLVTGLNLVWKMARVLGDAGRLAIGQLARASSRRLWQRQRWPTRRCLPGHGLRAAWPSPGVEEKVNYDEHN